MEWHGDEFLERVRSVAGAAIAQAGVQVADRAQQLVSMTGHRLTGARGHTYRTSTPGQPPHVETGQLWQSIHAEPEPQNMLCRIGSNLPYALYLELGTSRMAPRPWLRRALAESLSQAQATVQSALGGGAGSINPALV